MEISIIVSSDAANVLHGATSMDSDIERELRGISNDLGVTLQPMHPGVKDPELMKSFFVEVSTKIEAEKVVNALLKCPLVEGAYEKPEGEPP